MPIANARVLRLMPIAALVVTLVALATAERAPAAKLACPATFHVLHDDSIGKLKLPEGHYRITVLDSDRLSCSHAATLLARFLQDFDGKLPNGWRVIPRRAKFEKRDTAAAFRVKKVGGRSGGGGKGGGGRHPAKGHQLCPGTFTVEHNDRIGRLKLPRGEYTITLIKKRRIDCERAAKLFAKFLEDVDGKLPAPWTLNKQRAVFRKGDGGPGFRVKPAG